jgi:hypothetical protein
MTIVMSAPVDTVFGGVEIGLLHDGAAQVRL